jgi:DNA polymerase III epsilon subunit-like protein
MSWVNHSIFFIDFEGNQSSGILEYGIVELKGCSIVDTKTRLCKPCGPITSFDCNVHGIRKEMCDEKTFFSDEWKNFASLRERGPFAAHYSGTENSLIKATWPYARQSPDFVRLNSTVREWGPWIDTAILYGQFFPQFISGKLQDIIKAAGLQKELDLNADRYCMINRRDYHCALYDALAGALLLRALASIEEVAKLSLAQLIILSSLDPIKRSNLEQSELPI